MTHAPPSTACLPRPLVLVLVLSPSRIPRGGTRRRGRPERDILLRWITPLVGDCAGESLRRVPTTTPTGTSCWPRGNRQSCELATNAVPVLLCTVLFEGLQKWGCCQVLFLVQVPIEVPLKRFKHTHAGISPFVL